MSQKKVKLLRKLAKSFNIPFGVMKQKYESLNTAQRAELANELRRIESASL